MNANGHPLLPACAETPTWRSDSNSAACHAKLRKLKGPYLLLRGGQVVGYIKPVITGFDKVDLSREEEACPECDEPGAIR